VQILAGNAQPHPFKAPKLDHTVPNLPGEWTHVAATVDATDSSVVYVKRQARGFGNKGKAPKWNLSRSWPGWTGSDAFYQAMVRAGNADTYEAAHARLQCSASSPPRTFHGTRRRHPAAAAGQVCRGGRTGCT